MDQAPRDRRSVSDFFQHLWTQALGTVSGAEEETQKLLGRVQAMAGWSQDEVKKQVQQFSERLTGQRREVERRLDDTVKQAVARVRVPRREEIAQLNARLDALSRRVEALSK